MKIQRLKKKKNVKEIQYLNSNEDQDTRIHKDAVIHKIHNENKNAEIYDPKTQRR